MRTIVVLTQTLKPLPDEVLMSMKLLYYDDSKQCPVIVISVLATPHHIVTPPGYQPPGFQHSDFSEYLFKQDPLSIKVGDVATVRSHLSIFIVCYYVVVVVIVVYCYHYHQPFHM